MRRQLEAVGLQADELLRPDLNNTARHIPYKQAVLLGLRHGTKYLAARHRPDMLLRARPDLLTPVRLARLPLRFRLAA